jgi:hypothetical protein
MSGKYRRVNMTRICGCTFRSKGKIAYNPGGNQMKRNISLALLIVSLLCPVRGWAEETADTSAALHVLAGAAGALWISAVSYPLVDVGSQRANATVVAALAVGGAFIMGLTKELLDLRGWGQPQWSDLLLTVGGGLLAGTVVYAVTVGLPGPEQENWGISGVYGAFALILSLPVGENLFRRIIPS